MTFATVPSLPRPPLMAHYLFESPGLGVAAMIGIGLVAFLVLNRRGRAARGAAIGAVCLVLACGWWVTASMVITTREVLVARSESLVRAAGAAEDDVLGTLLAEQIYVVGRWDSIRRDDLLDELERQVRGRGGVESARVVASSGVIDGPNVGRTHVRVRVESSMPAPPLGWWRIDWVLTDGHWRAVRLEWLDAPDWVQRPGFD